MRWRIMQIEENVIHRSWTASEISIIRRIIQKPNSKNVLLFVLFNQDISKMF